MIIFHVRGDYWFRGSRTGFSWPETMCPKKIVLKFKSIVMWTTNNLFRRVLNCTHSKWWFTQFERKCNILEIFHYFQYFERFCSMKKWQISKPKIVDWYLEFSNESYTTLKSVISSFKYPYLTHGLMSWGTAYQTKLNKMKVSQNNCIRCIFFAKSPTPYFTLLEILKLENIFKLKIGALVHKIQYQKKDTPPALYDLV